MVTGWFEFAADALKENMPYPSAISPEAPVGNSPPQNTCRFTYNNNIYLVSFGAASDSGGGSWHCMKSTDEGLTWNEIDSAGAPARPFTLGSLNSGFATNYTIIVDGDQAILLTINATAHPEHGTPSLWADFTISKVVFNLTSQTWGSLTTSGTLSSIGLCDYATQTGAHSNRCSIQGVRRGTSDYLLYISGAEAGTEPSNKGRCSYITYDGSSFGSENPLAGQVSGNYYMPAGCVYDSNSGRTHFLLVGGTFSAGPVNVYHVAMDSGGSFGTLTTVISSATLAGSLFFVGANTGPSSISPPITYTYAGTTYVAFLTGINDGSFHNVLRVFAASEALNPSFLYSTITTDQSVAPQDLSLVSTQPQVFSLAAQSTSFGVFGISQSQPLSAPLYDSQFSLIPSGDASVAATWAYWDGNTGTPTSGFYYSTTNLANPLVWSNSPVLLIPVTPGDSTLIANQVMVYGTNIAPPPDSRTAADQLTLADNAVATFSLPGTSSDAIVITDGAPQIGLSVISNPADNIVPPPPGTGTPGPNVPPIGLSTCIFEFYEMQKPEDVEVLPVPKRYDQLGPMRFDKIGKIFALRIRLIMNGTTTSLPYAIYGDDSEASPHLNSPLYSDSFAVRPGFDNVYEIQLPKSVNTDVFRLTLGPVADSFHRYNVIVKVHISGMQGQAKWLPIR